MANKKLFGSEIGLTTNPALTKRIAIGDTGSTVLNMTMGALRAWITGATAPSFLQKVVNITSYDMEGGDRNKDVYLGIARTKIRSCTVLIRSNDGGLYPIMMQGNNKEIKSYWFIRQELAYASNALLAIRSESGSFFNQSAFNGTTALRGYIYIIYVP